MNLKKKVKESPYLALGNEELIIRFSSIACGRGTDEAAVKYLGVRDELLRRLNERDELLELKREMEIKHQDDLDRLDG